MKSVRAQRAGLVSCCTLGLKDYRPGPPLCEAVMNIYYFTQVVGQAVFIVLIAPVRASSLRPGSGAYRFGFRLIRTAYVLYPERLAPVSCVMPGCKAPAIMVSIFKSSSAPWCALYAVLSLYRARGIDVGACTGQRYLHTVRWVSLYSHVTARHPGF